MSAASQPPEGADNPLGAAFPPVRLGPCVAGAVLSRDEWPWNEPCSTPATGILRYHSEDPEADEVVLPLCSWHKDLLEAGGVSGPDPGEPS